MPYIGNPPAERFTSFAYQDLTGGSGTSFTLDNAVGNPQEIEVFVNNVRQEPGVAYTVSGTALTMTGSIATTDDFYVVFQGKAIQTATHPSDRALTATDGTFTSSFTSPGIDDNADATAITIDSSENVMIGTTDSTPVGSGGISLRNEGRIDVSRDGGIAANFDRRTSNGIIAQFFKDGTTVGSIGVPSSGTELFIQGTSAKAGLRLASNKIVPFRNDADADDAVDFGKSDSRFKDLYLSGGAYLGGTGSANHLDDYEEGTWTPAGTSLTVASGTYTKIGRFVTLNGIIESSDYTTNSVVQITGVPFTIADRIANTSHEGQGAVSGHNNNDSGKQAGACIARSQGYIEFHHGADMNTSLRYIHHSNNWSIRFTITYFT